MIHCISSRVVALYPRKQASGGSPSMSAKCQTRTSGMLSFDDLVGATQQWQRELHTECQRRLEIDCELHFCVLLDRQLGRIDTPQNFPGVNTNQPARIQQAWAITHHA